MVRGTWLLILALVFLVTNKKYMQCVHGEEPQVPCLFIFGDSLSDSGNNNKLSTTARSNYKPYGIDFPTGNSTGRFTNGPTVIDIISKYLGFEKFIPPFAEVGNEKDVLKGANYASGGAGIRAETSTHMGDVMSLGTQLTNHKMIFLEIATKLGGYDKGVEYLNKCVYYVNIGSDDYINNYFRPEFYSTSHIYTPHQYAKALVDQLSLTLQGLHQVGARKYVLVGLGYIGCIPLAISTKGKNRSSCVLEDNDAAFMFNDNLRTLVDQFNQNFSADSKFIFINTTAGTPLDQSRGFKVMSGSCCRTRGDGQCVVDETPCENRNEHIFYDQIHPTHAVNKLIAQDSYDSSSNPAFTYPMDIKHLVLS